MSRTYDDVDVVNVNERSPHQRADSERRWFDIPIPGLRSNDSKGRWRHRQAKLEHLKAVFEDQRDKEEPEEWATLARIDEALERIAGGTYGYCADCSKAIEEDVIRDSSPWLTKCTSCRK